jgi:digeranylgeranylglycerophospholipid reductase
LNAKQYLDRWIETQPGLRNGSIIEVNAGGIPVGGFLEKMSADNLLVAGDAGHMVDPIHGGGIGIAMEGGRLAAQYALKAIKSNKFDDNELGAYTAAWFELRGNELKRRLRSRHLLEQLNDDDFNYLAESLTMDEALKLGNGTLSKTELAVLFTKKLIKRPGLIKIIQKYFANPSEKKEKADFK